MNPNQSSLVLRRKEIGMPFCHRKVVAKRHPRTTFENPVIVIPRTRSYKIVATLQINDFKFPLEFPKFFDTRDPEFSIPKPWWLKLSAMVAIISFNHQDLFCMYGRESPELVANPSKHGKYAATKSSSKSPHMKIRGKSSPFETATLKQFTGTAVPNCTICSEGVPVTSAEPIVKVRDWTIMSLLMLLLLHFLALWVDRSWSAAVAGGCVESIRPPYFSLNCCWTMSWEL